MARIRFLLLVLLSVAPACHAVEMKISSDALERTLNTQLFNNNGRYYLRGNDQSPCFVVADSPHVNFVEDRIVVHVHVRAKLGTTIHGSCFGLSLERDVDVSLAPEAEGEVIGFRDARIDKLSGSRELDHLLMPFLSGRVPTSLKVNAADQLRQLLSKSGDTIGYDVTLDRFIIHSMFVQQNLLIVDLDGDVTVK